jgi:hypothetical protein
MRPPESTNTLAPAAVLVLPEVAIDSIVLFVAADPVEVGAEVEEADAK